jgi:hypothetical protein
LRRTVATLARVVCAPREAEATPATFEALGDEVERFLGSVPAAARLGIIGMLWTIELAPMASLRSPGRGFSALDDARAAALYGRWWSGALHPLAKLLKMVVSFSWYELPQVKAAMGYDPERWIDEVSRRRAATWADEIRQGERDVLAPDPLLPAPTPAPEVDDVVLNR